MNHCYMQQLGWNLQTYVAWNIPNRKYVLYDSIYIYSSKQKEKVYDDKMRIMVTFEGHE